MSKYQCTGTATQPQRNDKLCQFNKDQYCTTWFKYTNTRCQKWKSSQTPLCPRITSNYTVPQASTLFVMIGICLLLKSSVQQTNRPDYRHYTTTQYWDILSDSVLTSWSTKPTKTHMPFYGVRDIKVAYLTGVFKDLFRCVLGIIILMYPQTLIVGGIHFVPYIFICL